MTEIKININEEQPWNTPVDIANMRPKEQKKVFTELGQKAKIVRGEAPVTGSGLAGPVLHRRRGAITRRGR